MAYSILIIKTGALGDVLRTTSLLKGLKRKYKDSTISWITSGRAKDLLINNELIDKIYLINNKKEVPEFFDLILSFDDEKEAAILATSLKKNKLIGAYVKEGKVTYTEDSSDWFGMGLLLPEEKGGLEEANRLKKQNRRTFHEIMAKISGTQYSKDMPILNLTEKEIEFSKKFAIRNQIKDDDLVIGLNTGAGKRWQIKKWSVQKTAELADLLIEKVGAKIILLGGKEERERNNEIIRISKNSIIDSGTENTLKEFASILNLCDLLVTSDTLAMFIGIALKKKLVVLIGPTSSSEIELFGFGKKLCADMSCLCCYKRKCDIKPNCMDKISVEMVYSAVVEQLK
ncbi:glycosyltransferase family 9 protein [Candidatus Woesearchaeota archaeon]|nr:glycosyltransferase family 9 protein [Candidatus Woesearchaeota archaeon]